MKTVPIVYFSDVLCIWAYIAQWRVDYVKKMYGEQVRFESRFVSVFPDTEQKIAAAWPDGHAGYNAHVRHVVTMFSEVELHPGVWLDARPASSTGCHVWLKGAKLAEKLGRYPAGSADALTWGLRCAFFRDGRNIADRAVQSAVCRAAGLDPADLDIHLNDGTAFAELAHDHAHVDTMRIQGSPSFVLNDGRQKLYGNIGYKVIEANIEELLREPLAGQASWC